RDLTQEKSVADWLSGTRRRSALRGLIFTNFFTFGLNVLLLLLVKLDQFLGF
ncbi:hypothetical protein TorRG33x02_264440, partial [Trema orientale]